LNNISIVLVEPRGSANVGSVARAMKNTGFRKLILVNSVEHKNDEAFSMACNASDILLSAVNVNDLDGALKSMRFIVGTTRRSGKERSPMFLHEAVPIIVNMTKKNPVAILFGREDRGLKNVETATCDMLLEIPTHPSFRSINLSHAVFSVCHQIFTHLNPEEPAFEIAGKVEVEMMYRHIERVLQGLGYKEKGKEHLFRAIMRNLKRLFGRTGLIEKEVNMIRGICAQVEEKIKD